MAERRPPPRRGIHEIAILLATRSWILVAALFSQALLARMLAPEGRGVFAACTMFAAVFGVFFALGSDRGAQYQMMAGRQSLSRSTSVGLVVALLASAIAVAIAIPLSTADLAFFRNMEPSALRIALLLIPATLVGTLVELQLAGARRFGWLAGSVLVHTTLYLATLAVLVGALDLGVQGAVAASVLAAGAKLIYGFRALARHDGLHLERPTGRDFRSVLSYGVSYYPARVGLHIDLQAGGLLLTALGTREEIGFFAAACALVFTLFTISNAIETVILPRIAGGSAREDLVGLSVRASALLTGAAALVFGLVAQPVVRLLYSDAFLPSVDLIWLLLPGTALYGSGKPLLAYFRGTDRAALCSWAIWIGLILNAGLLVALYPRIGVSAAAYSVSAGFALRTLFLALAYRHVTGRPMSDTWCPRRDDLSWAMAQVRGIP